jgi:hypothetical protein
MSNFYQKLPTMLAMKFVLSIIPDGIAKEIKIKIKNCQQFYQKYEYFIFIFLSKISYITLKVL